MQRRIWLLKLKEGMEEEYVRAHSKVWPKLVQAARDTGLRNHSVFVSGNTVVAYIEADDVDAAWVRLMATDVKQQWNEAMERFWEDSQGPQFEEVFHFD
jgi:L-rhamnose mutarotase